MKDHFKLRAKLNKIHKELTDQPVKMSYRSSIGGILNAYREGDLTFSKAEEGIKNLFKELHEP